MPKPVKNPTERKNEARRASGPSEVEARASARRKSPAPLVGRDTYVVLDPDGTVLVERGAAGPVAPGSNALTAAQRVAELYGKEVVLTVERRTLFGPAVPIYRVTRTADGTVFTNASSKTTTAGGEATRRS